MKGLGKRQEIGKDGGGALHDCVTGDCDGHADVWVHRNAGAQCGHCNRNENSVTAKMWLGLLSEPYGS